MDESFQTYLNRVARLTLPDTYESTIQHIQESPKFQPQASGERKAVPFPGYTVITPPWAEDADDSVFYSNLKASQERLVEQLGADVLVALPPDSFHVTLADLIWANAYRDAVAGNPQFEEQLHQAIAQSFANCKASLDQSPGIRWQVLGMTIMPRALAVCLIPENEKAYEQILQLRRSIYQNPALIALRIEQQYHFTAHITLGYFGDVSLKSDLSDRLIPVLNELNRQWQDTPQSLEIKQAELRKFDDMTRYYRQPNFPVFEF